MKTRRRPAALFVLLACGVGIPSELRAAGRPEAIGSAWEVMAPLPIGLQLNAVVASGPYVFSIGGASNGTGTMVTSAVFRYDTATDTWDTRTPMPAALAGIDAVAIGGAIYVPGGDYVNTTYVYDVAGDSWSTIGANGGFTGAGYYSVVGIGTDLYVLGGRRNASSTSAVWKLDTLTGTWSAGVPMQVARESFAAEALGGHIYVAGGVTSPGFVPQMTAEVWDGTAWSYITGVPNGGGAYTRWSYAAHSAGKDGLWIGAGRRDAAWGVIADAGYYDPVSGTWTTSPAVPALHQGRVYTAGAVASDGYFYVIGGRSADATTTYPTNERLQTNGPVAIDLTSFAAD